MKTAITYGFCLLMALCTACSRNEVDDVRFEVSVDNADQLKAGGNVTFRFSGNADYITFYSGTSGNNYANRQRTEADLQSLSMSCALKQQYNDSAYLNKEVIGVFLSTDFSGDYTAEALNKATWIPLSGREYNRLPVPCPVSASAVETAGEIDLAPFVSLGQPFYIAFQYNAAGRNTIPTANGGGHYTNRPRVDITDLTMTKVTTDGETVEVTNAISEWAFRIVFQQSATRTNYQVNDTGLLFQPQKASVDATTGKEPDEIVWMVSGQINPRTVEPDRGTAIKTIEAHLPSYTCSYPTAGTYNATFIATNANLWNGKQEVRQLTITINP